MKRETADEDRKISEPHVSVRRTLAFENAASSNAREEI